jgi:nicotinamidase-related amidase
MTNALQSDAAALVVVDVQHDVVDGHYRRDEVVANIAGLVDRARRVGVPVVWIQHADEGMPVGSWEWEIVPELSVVDGDAIVQKVYGDAFEDTELHEILRAQGIGTVVIVGGQSDACIRSTLHGAFARGYNTTLVADAHTGPDRIDAGGPTAAQIISLTNRYWAHHTGVGRVARVLEAAEVEF